MFKKKNNHYFFQTLQKYQNVVHGISTTSFGNMDYRFGNRVEVDKNRQHFFSLLNILQENVIEMDQVHGTNVVIVGKKDRGEVIPKTDSLITNQKNIFLMIKTADCLPIIFFDPKKLVLAVCHAGFLGTVEKIFFHTIFAMIKNFNCKIDNVQTYIGPSICSQCFFIQDGFLQPLPEWQKFLKKKTKKTFVDLKNFTLNNLKKIGILSKNIFTANICTFESQDFYSHRRCQLKKALNGRFVTVVGLV